MSDNERRFTFILSDRLLVISALTSGLLAGRYFSSRCMPPSHMMIAIWIVRFGRLQSQSVKLLLMLKFVTFRSTIFHLFECSSVFSPSLA